ncbi:hypothetical protein BH18ACI5_BH18ACI5_05920 [soil metagenome]
MFGISGGAHGFERGVDHASNRDQPQVQPQFAGDDPRDVEEILDQLRLQPAVAIDDLDGTARRVVIETAPGEQPRPAEDGIELRSQFVGKRRQEFVFGAVRFLRLEACALLALEKLAPLRLGPLQREGETQAALEAFGGQVVLVEIVDRAGLHQRDSDFLVPLAGERNDRYGLADRAKLGQDLDAVSARQVVVQQHAVECVRTGGGQRRVAIRALLDRHVEARLLQQPLDGEPVQVIVVDQQNAEWDGHELWELDRRSHRHRHSCPVVVRYTGQPDAGEPRREGKANASRAGLIEPGGARCRGLNDRH